MIKPWYDKYPVLSLPNVKFLHWGPPERHPRSPRSICAADVVKAVGGRWNHHGAGDGWCWSWNGWENAGKMAVRLSWKWVTLEDLMEKSNLCCEFSVIKKQFWLTTVWQFESTNHAGDCHRWSLAGCRESDCLETSLEPSKTPGEHHKLMVNGCSSP